MEKPGNWFAIAKMWEKQLKKKGVLRKGPESLLKILHSWTVSVSACADQAPGFFVSWTLTPNGLFQTINELKRLMGYSKRPH